MGRNFLYNKKQKIIQALMLQKWSKIVPDRLYLKILYNSFIGERLDLENPLTFNEKLQWLKLHEHRAEYTMMVDKYLVREYVKNLIGEEYLIPLIGVWNTPEEIDFNALPNQFVMKCNHNSGTGMCICKDKAQANFSEIKKNLWKGLREDYYYLGREWPYKDVPRKIVCEKYMDDGSGEIKDFKFMCFAGKVKCSFVCSDRFDKKGLHVTFYDKDWNIMPFERHYPKVNIPHQKPVCYDEMLSLAEILSKDIPFVRVDLYEIKGKVYFGELTFFPGSGLEEFTPKEWDKKLGDWIKLPIIGE